MLNKVMIIGRLGQDPSVSYMKDGGPYCRLNIATDEGYTDKNGEKINRTEWHRVTVYGKQAENCATYLTKGKLVYVEGKLQTRKWQDQQGQDRTTLDIIAQRVQFLSKSDGVRSTGDNGQFRASDNEGSRMDDQAAKSRPSEDNFNAMEEPPIDNAIDDVPF